jgi:predicted small metal-binding protein
MNIRQILEEIATEGSIYDDILNNILHPNLHLKAELLSELAISFLENETKVNEVIKNNYFLYYFIRAAKNNVASNTSPFHKNVRIKDNMFIDNIEVEDKNDIELKMEKEEKYKLIDRNYIKIPKTHFQDILWTQYFVQGKTHREIAKEFQISHCLSWHEIKKIKEELLEKIKSDLNK